MAELFLAKDTRSNRLVVIKRILPYLAEETEFMRMFLDEARIAASLHHPNIVEVYELGHESGSTFIAMEWVDGVNLRRVLSKEQERGGAVPVGIAAFLVAKLCEGLLHAHEARDAAGRPLGIIHRDVSPQNVMVGFNGELKLVDFGIAKATSWMDRSKPGVIKGKFLYLAPEQLSSDPLDHRMDLFAVGVLLYELTCGVSPFHRSSTEAVIYAIRMEDPDPPGTVRPGFPPGLARIIEKCLVKDRARRYQSAAQVRDALLAWLDEEGATDQAEVNRYVTTHFGDDDERTSVYIPPNAQNAPTEPMERPGPPLPSGEYIAALPSTRTDRPKNPWEPEMTVRMDEPPAPSGPIALLRIPELAGEGEPDPTAISLQGESKVPVGEVFRPLMPTWREDPRPAVAPAAAAAAQKWAPEETRAAPITPPPPPVPSHRSSAPLSKPPPPLPSSDDIPEVSSSVISVSDADATLAAKGGPPAPPLRSTRKPPRSAPPLRSRTRSLDPDDFVDTVDLAAPRSLLNRLSGSRALLVIGVVAATLMALLLVIILWPSPRSAPPAPEITVDEPVVSAPVSMRVTLKPGKGVNDVAVDGKPWVKGTVIEHLPGPMSVKYTCPKRKGPRQQRAVTASIPATEQPVEVALSCD